MANCRSINCTTDPDLPGGKDGFCFRHASLSSRDATGLAAPNPRLLSERVRRFRKHLAEGGPWTLHEHAELLLKVEEELREYEDLRAMIDETTHILRRPAPPAPVEGDAELVQRIDEWSAAFANRPNARDATPPEQMAHFVEFSAWAKRLLRDLRARLAQPPAEKQHEDRGPGFTHHERDDCGREPAKPWHKAADEERIAAAREHVEMNRQSPPAEPEPAAGEALAEAVLPHALFSEAMRAAECCAGCAIDVFRRQRQVISDGEHVKRAAKEKP